MEVHAELEELKESEWDLLLVHNTRASRDETTTKSCWMLASILRTMLCHLSVLSRNMIQSFKKMTLAVW